MLLVKQSASKVVPFFMVDSSDHVSPKTGLTPSVQISKAGEAFAAAGGTVAEIGNGWYKITLSTTDTNTLGSLAFYITATGADPVSFSIQVVAFDPESSTDLGLSRIDANISTRATDSSVWSYSSRTLTSFGTLITDIWNNSTRTLTSFAGAGAEVWGYTTRTLTSFGTLVSDIWGYSSRTLTSFGTLVSDIWSYGTRTLTNFGTLVNDIWGYTTTVGVSALTVLERAYRTLVNKMTVNKNTGSVTLYADNNTGTAATGTITESDTDVTRSKLSWQ